METSAYTTQFGQDARRLRIDTLSRLRWLALCGQLATVLATSMVLQFPVPLALCLSVIGISALLNLAFNFLAPKSLRLADAPATALLVFDVLQLAALLYLTGGLENPFAILFLAPVTIAAVSLPPRKIVLIAVLTALAASILALQHLPLPWYSGQKIDLPRLYRLGLWLALMVACAFICVYASRVAGEARSLSHALTAAELVLERQNHLSQIDGLAAAAAHELGTPLATITLVTRELTRASLPPEFTDDLALLTQEVQRCREILGRLTSLAAEEPGHFGQTRLSLLLEQIVAPYRRGPVEIFIDAKGEGNEPSIAHSPAITYGIGNFLENAVDFARKTVTIDARWTQSFVQIVILDDGPGFSSEIVGRIGDPYVTSGADRRQKSEEGSGLGLGVFIAKTLLERTGAEIRFSNREMGGASVQLEWRHGRFENWTL
ncbi:ActS/PrrB/RegB family redox-sensitive histidine kinase [uncultured Rhodoblastus sp.]|uniref:ActS/PrrB/RegB family redox-sensitive histidine kinase n=1 Tax=uncultured Rhodoblastus sp. TaxID=543037 RepID=UPI0025F36AE3|nr:ActS/PrrB/RegB family redox-sensitive histidine kinase [uncultured Rhodoblastus sp.]